MNERNNKVKFPIKLELVNIFIWIISMIALYITESVLIMPIALSVMFIVMIFIFLDMNKQHKKLKRE